MPALCDCWAGYVQALEVCGLIADQEMVYLRRLLETKVGITQLVWCWKWKIYWMRFFVRVPDGEQGRDTR